jgi:hypothetical protein
MPFDPPFSLPPREPEDERLLRRVLADPTFRAAVIECVILGAQEMGLTEPIGPQGFAKVAADPVFQSRLSALALATLSSGSP